MKKTLTILFILLSGFCIAQNPSSSGYLLTYDNGAVSIGTKVNTAPLTIANFSTTFPAPQAGTMLHLVSDAVTNGRVSFDTYLNSNFTGSNYQGRRARGTAALPTAAILDDILVAIGGDGYGDDSFTGASVGSMNIRASGTFTNTSKPTYISFTTTPTGSTTQAERMRINADGTITGISSITATTFNGSFSGNASTATSAATLTTPRNIQGVAFNGSTNIDIINGTGFVKATGTTISYDYSTYLTTASAASTYQPLDADLTTIAGLTATTDNFIVSVSSAWASRTPAQVKTTLGLNNVTNESKATMFTSPTFTGTPVVPGYQPLATNLTSIGALANGNGFLKNNGAGVFTYENPAGSGTVTDVSVVTANGISGTVATSTSTPAITLTLGAITPTTVNGVTITDLLPKTTTSNVGSSPTASSTTTVTHNLGRVPSIIRIYGYGSFTSNAAATATTSSIGVYTSSGNFCVYQRYGAAITTTQAGLSSNTFAILLATGGGSYISGVIQNVTSTQFDIVWTETGTATAQVYLWEAQ